MVEKIPGGTIEDSRVLKGVMFNKDVTHPKMKRRIENPRILLLDCNLEYKKGESQTNIEIMKEEDFSKVLVMEEAYIKKICDEYFSFIEECKDPKACTILLRGASKDILNEVERNLQDALNVARNLWLEPALVPGGGATEMEVAYTLSQMAKSLNGVIQWPYKAVATALEIIPRTLAQNC